MQNFTIIKNCVFQGEIIFNFFHIHCELRSIRLLVKTAKERGGPCAFVVVAITLVNPFLRVKGQTISLLGLTNKNRFKK